MSAPNTKDAPTLGSRPARPARPSDLETAPPLDWTKLSPEAKREQLVKAADRVFVDLGLNAPMPVIAECAGVGVGSVYRQFDSKLDLIEAVVIRRFGLIERVAAQAGVGEGPAWPEFVGMVWTLVARQVAAGFFAQAWDLVDGREPVLEARALAHAELARLLARCREQGSIRPDATADDVWLIFAGARGATRFGGEAWRRSVTLMLDGLRV